MGVAPSSPPLQTHSPTHFVPCRWASTVYTCAPELSATIIMQQSSSMTYPSTGNHPSTDGGHSISSWHAGNVFRGMRTWPWVGFGRARGGVWASCQYKSKRIPRLPSLFTPPHARTAHPLPPNPRPVHPPAHPKQNLKVGPCDDGPCMGVHAQTTPEVSFTVCGLDRST